MICREPKKHLTGYFCLTNISGFTARSKLMVKYSVLPVPRPQETRSVDNESRSDVQCNDKTTWFTGGNKYDVQPLFGPSCLAHLNLSTPE
jgi:hypothetical protein